SSSRRRLACFDPFGKFVETPRDRVGRQPIGLGCQALRLQFAPGRARGAGDLASLGFADKMVWSVCVHGVALQGEVASILATSLPCLALLLMDRVGDGADARR